MIFEKIFLSSFMLNTHFSDAAKVATFVKFIDVEKKLGKILKTNFCNLHERYMTTFVCPSGRQYQIQS